MAARGKPKGSAKSGGRIKGTPNKATAQVKAALAEALEQSHEEGSVGYFKFLAKDHPPVFAGLVSKLIPNEVVGDFKVAATLEVIDLSDGAER